MKRILFRAALGAVVLIGFCAGSLYAQNVAFNGDFETGSYSPMWTLTGGNQQTLIAKFQVKIGDYSYCLKRRPGKYNDNGGFEQEVHLFEGVLYQFKADIASMEAG